MARPAHTPRLRQLDPTEVAARIVTVVAARTSLPLPEKPEETELGRAGAQLTRFAMGQLTDLPTVEDMIHQVSMAVYGRDPNEAGLQATSTIGTVLMAARGRHRLRRGESIPTREFAVLMGVDDSSVRRMARESGLAREERGRISARVALEQLSKLPA